jgi:hypothetical protein
MPESTIAIAGASGAVYAATGTHAGSVWRPVCGSVAQSFAPCVHSLSAPIVFGQTCAGVKSSSWIFTSGVIDSTGYLSAR